MILEWTHLLISFQVQSTQSTFWRCCVLEVKATTLECALLIFQSHAQEQRRFFHWLRCQASKEICKGSIPGKPLQQFGDQRTIFFFQR